MPIIAPTILTDNPSEFQKFLNLFVSFSKRIQIDFTDGTMTGTTTMPLANIPSLPTGPNFDLHIMSARPSDHLPHILRLKPSLCIFHAESSENLLSIISSVKESGIKVGIAFLKQSFPGKFTPYIEQADHILIFAGELGRQGGTADMLQIEKVKIIRNIKGQVEIGWDGGANIENVRALSHADIDVINVGSFISKNPNPREAYEALVVESDKRGVRL